TIMDVLKGVYDPEYPVSVIEMNVVDEDSVEILGDGKVRVTFKPTTPLCPMGGLIGVLIRYALEKTLNIKAEVLVKPGTHVSEDAINTAINDESQYEAIIRQLSDTSLLKRCVKVK
ncbi:MAG: iron-sulfur cluster assembly protein, partial [Nitrososphaerales archaeon]